MASLPNPVIVVPGIIATYLRDLYPIPSELVWTLLSKAYERAALHPDDLETNVPKKTSAFEAVQPARVVPDQLYEIAYKELIEELRYNLRAKEDRPVPVYPFGYDWRQPLETIQAELADFVKEVARRTSLLRHYYKDGYTADSKVNLVGHSMGGLVIAGYLSQFGGDKRIGKVVTLATPFQGSFEAVIKATTGTANLGTTAPSSREREAARMTPGLYYLMPSFAGGLKVADGLPKSLFDPGLWQPSIVATIAEYIRLHGLDPDRKPADRQAAAAKIFAAMLTIARDHRTGVDKLDLAKAGLTQNDWLCVVGVDSTTRVQLEVVRNGQNPEFAFRTSDRMDEWGRPAPADTRKTGDGTVPFAGAIPKFLAYESLVCVTPGDFGYWEIGDQVATELGGFHGIMPNMNMLHRLIVRFFTGRPDTRKNTWGLPAPGVPDDNWKPPLRLDRA